MTTLRVTLTTGTFTLEAWRTETLRYATRSSTRGSTRCARATTRHRCAGWSNELKSLDEENTALRREFETSRVTSTLVSSRATSDIVTSWTRETNEMLESARQQVGRIMDKANADAAAVVTAA